MALDDVTPTNEPIDEPIDAPEEGERDGDDPEPTSRFEDTATYRDQMIDAGRGHLVR